MIRADEELKSLLLALSGTSEVDPLTFELMKGRTFQDIYEALKASGSLYWQDTKKSQENSYWKRKPRMEDIRDLYKIVLRREPDAGAIEYVNCANLQQLLEVLIASNEARDHAIQAELCRGYGSARAAKPDLGVLLFGAYGNGNLGDSEQAYYVAAELMRAGIDPEQLAASSWISTSGYPFQGRIEGRFALVDPTQWTRYRLILIGGGGLLGVPHFPLHDQAWIDALVRSRVPYVLCAIGSERVHLLDPAFRSTYEKLVRHAKLVSGRDSLSMDALQEFRADALFAVDPILLHALRVNAAKRTAEKPVGKKEGLVAILKGPDTNTDLLLLDELDRFISSGQKVTIVSVHPDLTEDKKLLERYPNHISARSMDELRQIVSEAAFGVTMRLHGAIPFLEMNTPLMGFHASKIRSMFDMIGATVDGQDGSAFAEKPEQLRAWFKSGGIGWSISAVKIDKLIDKSNQTYGQIADLAR